MAVGTHLVVAGGDEVEQGNDGSLELGSVSSVDGGWAESAPDDVLAHVGGNEEGYSGGTNAVALGEDLVEEEHHHSRHEQLQGTFGLRGKTDKKREKTMRYEEGDWVVSERDAMTVDMLRRNKKLTVVGEIESNAL